MHAACNGIDRYLCNDYTPPLQVILFLHNFLVPYPILMLFAISKSPVVYTTQAVEGNCVYMWGGGGGGGGNTNNHA